MKLLIFDVYGTLISTGTGSLDAVKRILRACSNGKGILENGGTKAIAEFY